MYTFVDPDSVAERLEIARTLGLVTRYVVRSTDRANVDVRVWRNPATPEEAIRNYLARLLNGLVSDEQIAVLPPPPAESEVARPDTRIPSIPAAA